MRRLRTKPCDIPPETSPQGAGPVSLNQHKRVVSTFSLCSTCGITFPTQCILFGRTVFLLTFSPFGDKSCPSSWNGKPIKVVIGSFEPSWRIPHCLQSCFVHLSREPGPFQHMIHSALLEVLVPYRPFFWSPLRIWNISVTSPAAVKLLASFFTTLLWVVLQLEPWVLMAPRTILPWPAGLSWHDGVYGISSLLLDCHHQLNSASQTKLIINTWILDKLSLPNFSISFKESPVF